MSELFLQDDIIDAFKSKIDIDDYDKLKRVSIKYKKYFDLKPIIDSKKYDDIMIIQGCTVDILLSIITRHVIEKYNYKEIKEIAEQILKNKGKFSLTLDNKGHSILKYVIKLYYSCYNNNYNGIIFSLWIFRNFCNKNLNLTNIEYFVNPIISYIEDINREDTLSLFNIDDEYNDIDNSKIVICINLKIYLLIIMKRLNTIIPEKSPKKLDNQTIDIINRSLQENVIDYIDFNTNALGFPNYYIKYVKYICNKIML
jgi:hypothetical protein